MRRPRNIFFEDLRRLSPFSVLLTQVSHITLFLFFVFGISALAQDNVPARKQMGKTKVCSGVLSPNSDFSRSFLKLSEAALKDGIVSSERLKFVLQSAHPINPINEISTVQSEVFSEGFSFLLREPSALNWPWIVDQLSKAGSKRKSAEVDEAEDSHLTELIFDPHISKRLKVDGRVESEPLYIKLKNGTEYIVVGSSQQKLYLFHLKNLDQAIAIPTAGVVRSKPIFFESRDGREFLAFGVHSDQKTKNQTIYLLDLNQAHQEPEKIEIRNSKVETLSFSSSPTGPEVLNIGALREVTSDGVSYGEGSKITLSELITIDIDRFDQSQVKPLISHSWKNFYNIKLQDGSLRIVLSDENHLYFVNPGKDYELIKIQIPPAQHPTHNGSLNVSAQQVTLYHFVTNDGKDRLAVGNFNGGIDLFDPKNPKKKPMSVLPEQRLAQTNPLNFFQTLDHRDILSIKTDHNEVLFVDLADPQTTAKLQSHKDVQTKFEYFSYPDQREFVLFGTTPSQILAQNLNKSDDYVESPPEISNWAPTPRSFVDAFGRRIIYYYNSTGLVFLNFDRPENTFMVPVVNLSSFSNSIGLAPLAGASGRNRFFVIDGEDLVEIDLYKKLKSKELR